MKSGELVMQMVGTWFTRNGALRRKYCTSNVIAIASHVIRLHHKYLASPLYADRLCVRACVWMWMWECVSELWISIEASLGQLNDPAECDEFSHLARKLACGLQWAKPSQAKRSQDIAVAFIIGTHKSCTYDRHHNRHTRVFAWANADKFSMRHAHRISP